MTHHPTNDDQSNTDSNQSITDLIEEEFWPNDDSSNLCASCHFGKWRHKDEFSCKQFVPGGKLVAIGTALSDSNPDLHDKISRILVKWNMPTRQAAISEIVQLVEADTNAKAGSEEELDKILHTIVEHPYEESKAAILTWHTKWCAQASAQAEMRGRIEELETLQKLHTRTYRQTVTDNVGNVYIDDSHEYISAYETQERLAQLRAQGGDNK